MPNLNVCTGKAFSTGPSGELIIAGSNSSVWPFAGPIAANNGLNTDPVTGLWTAPHGTYGKWIQQSQTGLSAPVDTTHSYVAPTIAFTFTNPSTVASARVVALFQARANLVLTPQTALSLSGGPSFSGQPGSAAPIIQSSNPSASVTANFSDTFHATGMLGVLAPGAVASTPFTFNVAQTVGPASGSQVTSWWVDCLFLAWLFDPTQAGGVS